MSGYDVYKTQVVETCRKLVEKGFLIGTGGNVSVRIPGQAALAVTPSNYDYVKMRVDDICVVNFKGEMIEGALKPSIESSLHAAVYEHRADANVVIHTHQIYASAFALINEPIPALYDEQVRFLGRSVEVVAYAPSGTGFLKNNIVSRLKNNCNAYILQNHGAICLAGDAERAIFNVELLEKCALTYLLALCTEKKVTRIPLPIREIVFNKLRKDQKKQAELQPAIGGNQNE
ncbi:MAG TPA: class II aldolase/adducin family protein [Anaerolineaceae bacterium]|nr:class II aldolase/adducin family protein [Anaerolineaceae bacterium]HPN50245.1 class II aldolase/adducin family protein [Anaerolineaceae bacterium]